MFKKFLICVLAIIPNTVMGLDCNIDNFKLVSTNDITQIPLDNTEQDSEIKSLCLDDQETNTFDRLAPGAHCWCKLNSLHGYPISATWKHIKHYKTHKFNENTYRKKKNITESEIQRKKEETFRLNLKDCTSDCQSNCTQHSLNSTINGYYVCDKAQYTKSNTQCIIDKRTLDTENIRIFNDFAEITTKRIQIILNRDTTNAKTIAYIGEYDQKPIYLEVKNNKIYLGRDQFSMNECYPR